MNCGGIRLASESKLKEKWKPVLEKMGMKESHYYIYTVDTK